MNMSMVNQIFSIFNYYYTYSKMSYLKKRYEILNL